MSDQFGFDFADMAEPAYAELPLGGWLDPEYTTDEFKAIFERAALVLPALSGALAVLFGGALEAAKDEHAQMLEACERTGAYHLWRVDVPAESSLIEAFQAACIARECPVPGAEFKTLTEKRMTVHAMYVPDLGSLVVHQWAADNIGIDYYPWRDSFFLPSYRDGRRVVKVPESVFAGTYCADKIAESNEGIASVPVFMHEGREYINDGGMSYGTYSECGGWAFCSMADWNGPTYSYRTQVKAWDEGRTERGDRRGLVVRVRGHLAVLTGETIFYDDNATGFHGASRDEEEGVAPEEEEWAEDEIPEEGVEA